MDGVPQSRTICHLILGKCEHGLSLLSHELILVYGMASRGLFDHLIRNGAFVVISTEKTQKKSEKYQM
jgi:hypothetical protein